MYFVFFARKTKYKYINVYFKYKIQNTNMYFKYYPALYYNVAR